jgi:hypothetical protein
MKRIDRRENRGDEIIRRRYMSSFLTASGLKNKTSELVSGQW